MKRLFFIGILLFWLNVGAQECPNLTMPVNGAVNVPVNTTIGWESVTGVTGYIVSIGTTPGGTDIINRRTVGSSTSYTPPGGLPENTQLYVTITLFFLGNLPEITCASESFRTEDVVTPPPCTILRNPLDGASDINVANNIFWEYAPTATGYRLSIGTSPNGTEIVNDIDVGNNLSYNPPSDLPPSTPIYVRITPYNENGPAPNCPEYSFTTGALAVLPSCTSLITPANGAINVPLTPFLEWTAVPNASGYRVSIGTSPFLSDILNNGVFSDSATFVLDFEPNRTFFITIIPFNSAGDAIGCTQENFSTILGCGPYFDAVTGELITLNPEIDFPDEIGICLDGTPSTYTTTDVADGFRWYKKGVGTNETLISTTASVDLSEVGEYRYEAYNTVSQTGGTTECPSTKDFTVVVSEAPTIDNIKVIQQANGLRIETTVSGIGLYEYALDDISGPYQNGNIFNNVTPGTHTVYVRDKNGCGVAEETIVQDLTLEGFPKFFTPNGDGINDFWQFIPPPETGDINIQTIQIFDRYGNLLAQVEPTSQGWNGQLNGRLLPATDYWFRAISNDNKEIKGNFTLKR